MKNLLLSGAILLLLSNTQAQRVDLDRFNFSVSYREFPQEPLPEEYKTYNVRLEASPSLGYVVATSANTIEIEGLKRVPGTGHITVLAMLDDLVIDKTESRERIETKKNKEGVEVKRSYFSTEVTYSFAARVSVYDYKGNTILSNHILYDRDRKHTHKTSEFDNASEAANHYSNKVLEMKNNLAKQLVNGAINNLNSMLNARYGYQVRRANDIFWVLNNKRHAAYREHQKVWNEFKNAIVLMSADESLDKVKERLQPVIAFYEKEKSKYNTSDKEHRKLRYSAYYNLAKIYLWLDEPEKAKMEADALVMNDYDTKDGKALRSQAEYLQSVLKKNNAETRHFSVSIESYEPPVK